MIIAWLQLVVTFFVGSAYMASRAGLPIEASGSAVLAIALGYAIQNVWPSRPTTTAPFTTSRIFPDARTEYPAEWTEEQRREAESAIEALSHGRFSESAMKTCEASWNFILDLWRAVILLVNPLLAFLHSVFHNRYPWILNWAWYLFTATAPFVMPQVFALILTPLKNRLQGSSSSVSDTGTGPRLRAPLPIREGELKNVAVWTRSIHDHVFGRLEVSHRFVSDRLLKMLDMFDQTKAQGASMISAIEGIILEHLPEGLPPSMKSTSKVDEGKLSKISSDVRSHFQRLLIDLDAEVDAERHLRNCHVERGEPVLAFVNRYWQLMQTVAVTVELQRAREVLLPKLPVGLRNRLKKYAVKDLSMEMILQEARAEAEWNLTLQKGSLSYVGVGSAAPLDTAAVDQECEKVTEHCDPEVNQLASGSQPSRWQASGRGSRGRARGRSRAGRTSFRGSCYYCGKPGHRRADCWIWLKDQEKAQNVQDGVQAEERAQIPPKNNGNLNDEGQHNQSIKTMHEFSESHGELVEVALGNPGNQLQMKCGLSCASNVIRKKCLIDTGAGLNAIPLQLVRRQGWPMNRAIKKRVRAFNESVETSLGSVSLELQLGSVPAIHTVEFDVLENTNQVILGLPCLTQMGAVVDCKKGTVAVELTDGSKRCIPCVLPHGSQPKDHLRRTEEAQTTEELN